LAAGRKKKASDEEPEEDWLTTYADAITLLMAFFVMLVSFSKVDIPLYEQVAAGIRNEIGKRDTQSPMQILQVDLQDVVYNMEVEDVVQVDTDDEGVRLELASSGFYRAGSADIRDDAVPVLANLAIALAAPRYRDYVIEVEGHTDDDPISTVRFPSNWELSAGRAARVVRFFIDEGLDPGRMKAAGYAETRPKVPNRTRDGTPIPDNQAENRRVIIRLYPKAIEDESAEGPTMTIDEISSGAIESEQPPPLVPRVPGRFDSGTPIELPRQSDNPVFNR